MRKIYLFLIMLVVSLSAVASSFVGNRDDFRDETIYFVITTRFYDGDPSNNTHCWDAQSKNVGDPAWRGDFKGLIDKLDYIKALGFTAIWITPVVENASGYDYHGYHAMNMSKVDRRYESEGVTLQTLIDAVHAKGMKLIVDIVLNHTGNFGEANLCKLFDRDWNADQSDIEACMVPFTQKDGGRLPDNYRSLIPGEQYGARLREMKNTDGQNHDTKNLWHHFGNFNWDDQTRWWAQIAGDCVDLNTENPATYNYLIDCYTKMIAMGVDGFRIDTGGHIPRLVFNKVFIPAFAAAADDNRDKRNGAPFFMFTEVCSRYTQIWYREQPALSVPFYTWLESKDYPWEYDASSWESMVVFEGENYLSHTNQQSCLSHYQDNLNSSISSQPTSDNVFLNGNDYHTPDYSNFSGLSVIDFPMHHNFKDIGGAWSIAKSGDKYYNDASYNVVYVDSHDYAPNGAPEDQRFAQDTDAWAENLDLMFTFRGIPCLYYGSEIEFKKGCPIDRGTSIALKDSGRAYYGGYIKGDITVNDFADWTNASGNIAATLKYPLALHIQRLSKIRMAIPALRKGQYSTTGCSGNYSFKRRYTDDVTDSYVLVTISGNSTFTGVLNGTYVDAITGDVKQVTDGTLTATCSGRGNMRVYVLTTEKNSIAGKIGEDGRWLYASSPVVVDQPAYDGTEEELTDAVGGGGGGEELAAYTPQYYDDQMVAFFEAPADGSYSIVRVWCWSSTTGTHYSGSSWPGERATLMGLAENGNKIWKWTFSGTVPVDDMPTHIIFNNSGQPQTANLEFQNGGYYTTDGLQRVIPATSGVTPISRDGVKVYASSGDIVVVTDKATRVDIVSIDGRSQTRMARQGTNRFAGFPRGLYIVNGKKVIL